jgi:hypothetical protein
LTLRGKPAQDRLAYWDGRYGEFALLVDDGL